MTPTNTNSKICPNCGERNPLNYSSCVNCGANLDVTQPGVYDRTQYVPPRPQPLPLQPQPQPRPPRRSPLPVIAGLVAAVLVVVLIIVLAVVLPGIDQSNKNATATAVAQNLATASVVAQNTATAVQNSTSTANAIATQNAVSTANAIATQNAASTATATANLATAQAQFTAASQTQTAQAKATLIASYTPTPAPTPTRASTPTPAGARATAEASRDGLDKLRVSANYGPADGTLTMNEEKSITSNSLNLKLRDFVVEATFDNPGDSSVTQWSYGFFLRKLSNKNYRVAVASNGTWQLATSVDGKVTTLSEGNVANFDRSTRGFNRVKVYVDRTTGYLYVNNEYISTFTLDSIFEGGDIQPATHFFNDDYFAGKSINYHNLTVYDFEGKIIKDAMDKQAAGVNAFGPKSGSLSFKGDTIDSFPSDKSTKNFKSQVIFVNPSDQKPWSYGYIFRDIQTSEYRVEIFWDKSWKLVYLQDGKDPDVVKQGTISNLDVSANGSNSVTFYVNDSLAFLYVNNNYIDSMLLSQNQVSGSVEVSASFNAKTAVEGRSINFKDFFVWPL